MQSAALATLAFVCMAVSPAIAGDPTTLTGTVTHVRDGDTIEVGKIPIRLNGVSAPELKEPLWAVRRCGRAGDGGSIRPGHAAAGDWPAVAVSGMRG